MADLALSLQAAVDAASGDVVVIGRIDGVSGNFEVKKIGIDAAASGIMYGTAIDNAIGTGWRVGSIVAPTIEDPAQTDLSPSCAAVVEYVDSVVGVIDARLDDILGN